MSAAQNLEPDEIAELVGQRLQVVAVERERREHAQPAERGGQLLELVVGEVAYAPGGSRAVSAPAPRGRLHAHDTMMLARAGSLPQHVPPWPLLRQHAHRVLIWKSFAGNSVRPSSPAGWDLASHRRSSQPWVSVNGPSGSPHPGPMQPRAVQVRWRVWLSSYAQPAGLAVNIARHAAQSRPSSRRARRASTWSRPWACTEGGERPVFSREGVVPVALRSAPRAAAAPPRSTRPFHPSHEARIRSCEPTSP